MEKICACHENKIRSEEERHLLINRLSRIEGQIRGIRGMVEKDAYCPDILTQVTAVTSALHAFNRELLASHVKSCVATDIKEGREDVVDELCRVLEKMMK